MPHNLERFFVAQTMTLLHRFLIPSILACSSLLTAVLAEDHPLATEIHTDWPFDATEAKHRQHETAERLGLPVSRQLEIPGGEHIELVLIPAGSFTIGTPETEPTRSRSEQKHRVSITTPFYMARFVITQAQWQAVTGSNPSLFKNKPDSPMRPVEHVSYLRINDELLPKLQAKAPSGWVVRLPTEAEWEWACRAGTATAFWFGDSITTDQANYDGSNDDGIGKPGVKRGETTPVDTFPANAWGLHDMHGNVFQWCRDSAGSYSKEPVDDPCNVVATKNDEHILRGGCWIHAASKCRSGARYFSPANYFAGSIGVRLVLAHSGTTTPSIEPK